MAGYVSSWGMSNPLWKHVGTQRPRCWIITIQGKMGHVAFRKSINDDKITIFLSLYIYTVYINNNNTNNNNSNNNIYICIYTQYTHQYSSIAVYCWFSLHQWLERRPDPRSQRWIGSWTGIIPMTPPASWPWLFLDVCWEDAVSENLRKFKFRSGNSRIIRKPTKVRVNSRRHHPFGNGL